jgi:4-hydroxymandelate synthase
MEMWHMTTLDMHAFENMLVDHVEFYVADISRARDWLVDGYGFAVYGTGVATPAAEARSVALGRGDIRLVLTEPLVSDHPGAAYVEKHGDGVAGIAMRVPDAARAFREAVRRGARPVSGPAAADGVVTATIMGFGDVTHTFVQRPDGSDERVLPGLRPVAEPGAGWDAGLVEVDHFAVCLEAGQLDPTVDFYVHVLGFDMTFTERIVVGAQAMNSKVVRSGSGAVTLTLIEPDLTRDAGQIDEFVKNHGGAGVQHIAFTARDITAAVGAIAARGVEFLSTPSTYYELLRERLELSRHSVEDLRELNVLADEDHYGQLFQIFARSVHPRKTIFLEIIERVGARTFGSGNIKSLYEAVELQRNKDAAKDSAKDAASG